LSKSLRNLSRRPNHKNAIRSSKPGAGFLDLFDILYSELNCVSVDMLIINWIALSDCVAYALHCPNTVKLELFYLIDLHAGMVINCVDQNDLILELKSPCLYHHRLVDMELLSSTVMMSPRG